jgi:hypothetical protein
MIADGGDLNVTPHTQGMRSEQPIPERLQPTPTHARHGLRMAPCGPAMLHTPSLTAGRARPRRGDRHHLPPIQRRRCWCANCTVG